MLILQLLILLYNYLTFKHNKFWIKSLTSFFECAFLWQQMFSSHTFTCLCLTYKSYLDMYLCFGTAQWRLERGWVRLDSYGSLAGILVPRVKIILGLNNYCPQSSLPQNYFAWEIYRTFGKIVYHKFSNNFFI